MLFDCISMGVFRVGVLPSQRGYLFDDNYFSKESRKEKIEADGIKIKQNGEKYSYLVDEFKKHRFDLSNYRITVMKTDEEQFEQNIIVKKGSLSIVGVNPNKTE